MGFVYNWCMHFYKKYIAHPHAVVVAVIGVVSVVMLVWSMQGVVVRSDGTNESLVEGRVVGVERAGVGGIGANGMGIDNSPSSAQLVRIEITRKDVLSVVTASNELASLHEGARVYLEPSVFQDGAAAYRVVDVNRQASLIVLAAIFFGLVLLIGGVKGIYAIVGLVYTMMIIFSFMVPQILGGSSPMMVAMVGAVLMLVGTFYVSEGFNRRSMPAFIGIALTLAVVIFAAQYFIYGMHFSGMADESAMYLRLGTDNRINFVGLMLAGIVVASLGVLDDVAITQSSVVAELWSLDASLAPIHVFRKAMRVGRDHIAAVVNTLVLAYVGASMSLVLLFVVQGMSLGYVVNSEFVATEIVRTLVASSGLLLVVPFTTWVAVALESGRHVE